MTENLQTPSRKLKESRPSTPSSAAGDSITTVTEDDKFVSEDLTVDNFAFTQLLILTLTLPPITSFSSVIIYFGGLGLTDPLYGSYFKTQYTLQFITTAIILGLTVGLSPFFKRPLPHRIPNLLSLASLSIAISPAYSTLITTLSEAYGPQWPPHIIYLFSTYSPIFLLSWANATLLHDCLKLFLSTDTWIHGLSLIAFHGSLLVSTLGGTLNWYNHIPFSNQSVIMLLVGALTIIFYVVVGRWLLFPINKQRLSTKLAAPLLIIIITVLTLFYHPGSYNKVIDRYHGSVEGYKVLARHESITGWISVLEEKERKIRVLRSGHCLLGGIYTEFNESIFHNFYVMDAIHLIKRKDQSYRGKVLMIGLGIGTSADPLIKLDYNVEIIELDPFVYKYAREHFHLSKPSKVHLLDAKIPLTQEPSPLSPPYQFIMHDVFNGAGVDGEYLFTQEALKIVEGLLEENDGTLALNLVSGLVPPYDQSFVKVTTTLKSIFKYVRCFKEPHEQDEKTVKVQNLVFFASNSPIEFTPVTEEVFNINQGLAYILDKFQNFEVNLNTLEFNDKNILRSDDPTVLDLETAKNQKELMLYHWTGMNSLLPWSTWLIY